LRYNSELRNQIYNKALPSILNKVPYDEKCLVQYQTLNFCNYKYNRKNKEFYSLNDEGMDSKVIRNEILNDLINNYKEFPDIDWDELVINIIDSKKFEIIIP
jgi:hypothetical protein